MVERAGVEPEPADRPVERAGDRLADQRPPEAPTDHAREQPQERELALAVTAEIELDEPDIAALDDEGLRHHRRVADGRAAPLRSRTA